jgi:GT2 family glycosyltransferase
VIIPISKAKVAIITINYNGYSDTVRLLENLQEIKDKIAVVVIDNASDNDEASYISEKFQSIKVIKSLVNRGFGFGNNLGAKYCFDYENIEYLFILNNDTTLIDGSILKLQDAIESDADITCVSPVILNSDKKTIWFGGGKFSLYNAGVKSWFKNKSIDILKNLPEKITSPFISGCAMFFKKESYRILNGFDEDFFMYIEDIDLSYRMNFGGNSIILTSVVIIHFAHSSLKMGDNVNTPLTLQNPSIDFYISNVIKGSFLFYRKNFTFLYRVIYYVFLFMKWQKNIIKIRSLSKAVFINRVFIENLFRKKL